MTNMCMIRDGTKVLVQDKIWHDLRGIIFPGGHVEPHEPIVDSVIREVREETGLTLSRWRYRGIVTFLSDIYPAEQMHLFTADAWTGEERVCDEGDLSWIKKKDFAALPMWEGDKIFLDLLDGDRPFFRLTLVYLGERLTEAVLDGEKIR